MKNNKVPPWIDLIIRDPWEQWKEANPEWMKQDEEKKRRKKEQDKIDPRLLLNSTVEAVRAENKEAECMAEADFIRLPSDGEDVESEENSSEDGGDSDNSEDIDFTTFSHRYYE